MTAIAEAVVVNGSRDGVGDRLRLRVAHARTFTANIDEGDIVGIQAGAVVKMFNNLHCRNRPYRVSSSHSPKFWNWPSNSR